MKSTTDNNVAMLNERYFLKCLDFAQNPIVIWGEKTELLFANTAFCNLFHIPSREKAIGTTLADIMRKGKIKAIPVGSKRPGLKVPEVLQSGIEVLDWNVYLEYERSPNERQILSTDMYPIKDATDNVTGVIEIYRSHEQEIKSARKIMGLSAGYDFNSIIGYSQAIRDKINIAKQFAKSSANVLVTGESGVGKELFAQAIHNHSSRSKGPFVALNCASFPSELIESELFGYVEGAFTGASKRGQTGKIELADGGTLFLDEIGELPYYFQPKLLRVLETWTITKVGDSKPIPVDVRLVAATNRNLEKMVEEGLFRSDLYYRLQVLNVEIPPLRDRREDIVPLAEYFLEQFASDGKNQAKTLTNEAKRLLSDHLWPGNVRELKNVISRIAILSPDPVIDAGFLESILPVRKTPLVRNAPEAGPGDTDERRIQRAKEAIQSANADLVHLALEITGGKRKEAADLIGVSRNTFYRMMKKHELL